MKNKYIIKFKLNLPQDNINPSGLGTILGSKNINVMQFCSLYNSLLTYNNKKQINSLWVHIYKNNVYKLVFKSSTVVSILNEFSSKLKLNSSKFSWKNYITEAELYLIINKKFKNYVPFLYKNIQKSIKSYLLTMNILIEL